MFTQKDTGIPERMSASMNRDENRRERFEWWSFRIGDILGISTGQATDSSGRNTDEYVLASIERENKMVVKEARRRRRLALDEWRKPIGFQLDDVLTNLIYKEWQDKWRDGANRRRRERIKKPHSMVETYLQKEIYPSYIQSIPCYLRAKVLIWLVLKTGWTMDRILRCALAERAANPAPPRPVRTKGERPKTLSQGARYLRKTWRYWQNKSADYLRERNMCANCHVEELFPQRLTPCAICSYDVCPICKPEYRHVCNMCPECDRIISEGRDLGNRCQKCLKTVEGVRRCTDCRLAICDECCMFERPRCHVECPGNKWAAYQAYLEGKNPRPPLRAPWHSHKRGKWYVEHVWKGWLKVKANKLTSKSKKCSAPPRTERITESHWVKRFTSLLVVRLPRCLNRIVIFNKLLLILIELLLFNVIINHF